MTRPKIVRRLDEATPLEPALERITTPRVGVVAGLTPEGLPLVELDGDEAGPRRAVATVWIERGELEAAAARRQQVMLVFDRGDPRRPVVLGLVGARPAPPPVALRAVEPPQPDVTVIDATRLRLEGKDEIVLVCGKASITLRRNGRVAVRGAQVETDADGVNRIKGASVRIN